jgi:hypothetical protein
MRLVAAGEVLEAWIVVVMRPPYEKIQREDTYGGGANEKAALLIFRREHSHQRNWHRLRASTARAERVAGLHRAVSLHLSG